MNSSTLMRAAGNARVERDDQSAAERGAALRLQPVDRGDEIFAIVGRRLHHGGRCGDRDDPMRTLRGCASMKVFAASRAALRRFGLTSVARMLFDMSSARTIASSRAGNVSAACGRAIARISAVSASVHNTNGSAAHAARGVARWSPPTADRFETCILRRRFAAARSERPVECSRQRHRNQQPQHARP